MWEWPGRAPSRGAEVPRVGGRIPLHEVATLVLRLGLGKPPCQPLLQVTRLKPSRGACRASRGRCSFSSRTKTATKPGCLVKSIGRPGLDNRSEWPGRQPSPGPGERSRAPPEARCWAACWTCSCGLPRLEECACRLDLGTRHLDGSRGALRGAFLIVAAAALVQAPWCRDDAAAWRCVPTGGDGRRFR